MKIESEEDLIKKFDISYSTLLFLDKQKTMRESFDFLMICDEIYSKKKFKLNEKILKVKYQLGLTFYFSKRYKKAIPFFEFVDKNDFIDKSRRVSAMNTLSLIYRKLNKYEIENTYLKKALIFAEKNDLHDWKAVLKGNIGASLVRIKQFEKAKNYLIFDVESSIKNKEWFSGINALMLLYELKINNRLEIDINLLDSYYSQIPEYDYTLSNPDFHRLKAYHSHLNSKNQTFEHFNKCLEMNDSISRSLESNSVVDLEFQSEYKKRVLEIKNSVLQKKYLKIFNYFLIVSLIFIIIIFWVIINFQLKKRRRLKEEHNNQIKETYLKIEKNKQKIFSLVNDLNIKSQVNQSLQNELIYIKTKYKTIETSDLSTLKQKIESFSLVKEEDLKKFEESFNIAFPLFIENIKKKCPNITNGELRYACLLKLNLPKDKLLNIMGVSEYAIRKVDLRLRKKLNISGSSNELITFLNQLKSELDLQLIKKIINN